MLVIGLAYRNCIIYKIKKLSCYRSGTNGRIKPCSWSDAVDVNLCPAAAADVDWHVRCIGDEDDEDDDDELVTDSSE